MFTGLEFFVLPRREPVCLFKCFYRGYNSVYPGPGFFFFFFFWGGGGGVEMGPGFFFFFFFFFQKFFPAPIKTKWSLP